MGELKSLRIERKLTQNQAADILGVSLRSYKSYENDEKKADSIKYKYMIEKISEINPIDEENGIVDIDYIKRKPTDQMYIFIDNKDDVINYEILWCI